MCVLLVMWISRSAKQGYAQGRASPWDPLGIGKSGSIVNSIKVVLGPLCLYFVYVYIRHIASMLVCVCVVCLYVCMHMCMY